MFTRPSRWLSYTDRDEDFFPKVLPSASSSTTQYSSDVESLNALLPSYFSAVESDIGSICFRRIFQSGLLTVNDLVSEEVAATPPLKLSHFASAWTDKISPYNKCVHRLRGYEMASVQ